MMLFCQNIFGQIYLSLDENSTEEGQQISKINTADMDNDGLIDTLFYDFQKQSITVLLNGYYIGGASEGSEYWLEKWNPKKKKYEFFDSFEGFIFYLSHDWFWTSNSTVLFRYGWHESAKYYEMEISEK